MIPMHRAFDHCKFLEYSPHKQDGKPIKWTCDEEIVLDLCIKIFRLIFYDLPHQSPSYLADGAAWQSPDFIFEFKIVNNKVSRLYGP